MTDERAPHVERGLAVQRLAAGAVQGLALYLLYRTGEDKVWPGSDPYLLAPLSMVFLFVPLLFAQATGEMRRWTLILWLAVAIAVLAGLGWYDVWRFEPRNDPVGRAFDAVSVGLLFVTFVGLFIAQSLLLANDGERTFVAKYATYFEASTKLAVQFAATVAFVAVFWGVLWLGVVLFNLIKLDFLEKLVEKEWFSIPATTLAAAAAIHVSDARARLWTGIRTVALTLLSWLLPLMTLIAGGFLFSLFFTGLGPLWATRSAAGLLLSAAGVLVVLINAAYQDGGITQRSAVFRYSEGIASLLLTPLVALSAYAVWLRVAQYGWTSDRVTVGATLLVAACYALGYGAAAVTSALGGEWMRLMAPVNVATSYVVIAVLLGLFTPLADPHRIAVESQVARLEHGAVRASKFDFSYLKNEGGRYGHEALERLVHGDFGAETATVRKLADAALKNALPLGPAPVDLSVNLTAYPAGTVLPASFLKADWDARGKTAEGEFVPACLRFSDFRCDVLMADLDGDGHDEVIVLDNDGIVGWGGVFRQAPDGLWHAFGRVSFPSCAVGMREAWRKGDYRPVPQTMRNLAAGGVVLDFAQAQSVTQHCD